MQGTRIAFGTGLALVLAASGAVAGEYASGFGFGITVPDVYLVLTAEEVTTNAELFLDESGGDVPLGMRREVFDRVRAGEIEIFYRTEDVDPNFVDNVNVMVQRAHIPSSAAELDEICRLLPVEFSRMFGRPIGLDECELRAVAGRPSLYLAFDGALAGTKTLQYQVQRSPQETLILTATANVDNVTRMLGEFEAMVTSIRPR